MKKCLIISILCLTSLTSWSFGPWTVCKSHGQTLAFFTDNLSEQKLIFRGDIQEFELSGSQIQKSIGDHYIELRGQGDNDSPSFLAEFPLWIKISGKDIKATLKFFDSFGTITRQIEFNCKSKEKLR